MHHTRKEYSTALGLCLPGPLVIVIPDEETIREHVQEQEEAPEHKVQGQQPREGQTRVDPGRPVPDPLEHRGGVGGRGRGAQGVPEAGLHLAAVVRVRRRLQLHQDPVRHREGLLRASDVHQEALAVGVGVVEEAVEVLGHGEDEEGLEEGEEGLLVAPARGHGGGEVAGAVGAEAEGDEGAGVLARVSVFFDLKCYRFFKTIVV